MSEDVNMLYMKFPVVLRNKLLSGEVILPDATVFEYEDILVYRAVARRQDDNSSVDINDFKSYFELNKTPKTARGVSKDVVSDPHYYGVSSFLQRERVEQIMHFPNPNKKMAKGYVCAMVVRKKHEMMDMYVGGYMKMRMSVDFVCCKGEYNE